MLKRLHLRVFKEAVDSSFLAAFMDYYNGRGEFSDEAMALAEWEENAKEKASLPWLYTIIIGSALTQYNRTVSQIPSRCGRALTPRN
jgi:hypothetical protein